MMTNDNAGFLMVGATALLTGLCVGVGAGVPLLHISERGRGDISEASQKTWLKIR
jgi:hypothetical protein